MISKVRSAALSAIFLLLKRRQLRRRLILLPCARRQWVSTIFRYRETESFQSTTYQRLRSDTIYGLESFLRMNENSFKFILQKIQPLITAQSIRKPISAEHRLLITLKFLSSGDSFRSLSLLFHTAHNTISLIVKQVCTAIIKKLGPIYLRTPSTAQQWRKVEAGFRTKWGFPGK